MQRKVLTSLEEDFEDIGLNRKVEEIGVFGSLDEELAVADRFEGALEEALKVQKTVRMSPADRAKARADYRSQKSVIKTKRKKLRKKPAFKRHAKKLKTLKKGKKAGVRKRFIVTGLERIGTLQESIQKFAAELDGNKKEEMISCLEHVASVASILAERLDEAEAYVDEMSEFEEFSDEDDDVENEDVDDGGDVGGGEMGDELAFLDDEEGEEEEENEEEEEVSEEALIVGDDDFVKSINLNNWDEIVAGIASGGCEKYEGKGQEIDLDGQRYKVTGEVGDMVQLSPITTESKSMPSGYSEVNGHLFKETSGGKKRIMTDNAATQFEAKWVVDSHVSDVMSANNLPKEAPEYFSSEAKKYYEKKYSPMIGESKSNRISDNLKNMVTEANELLTQFKKDVITPADAEAVLRDMVSYLGGAINTFANIAKGLEGYRSELGQDQPKETPEKTDLKATQDHEVVGLDKDLESGGKVDVENEKRKVAGEDDKLDDAGKAPEGQNEKRKITGEDDKLDSVGKEPEGQNEKRTVVGQDKIDDKLEMETDKPKLNPINQKGKGEISVIESLSLDPFTRELVESVVNGLNNENKKTFLALPKQKMIEAAYAVVGSKKKK